MKRKITIFALSIFTLLCVTSCTSPQSQLRDYQDGVDQALWDIKEGNPIMRLYSDKKVLRETNFSIDRNTGFPIRYCNSSQKIYKSLSYWSAYNRTLSQYVFCLGPPECSYKKFENIIFKSVYEIEKSLQQVSKTIFPSCIQNRKFIKINSKGDKVAWSSNGPTSMCAAYGPALYFIGKGKTFDLPLPVNPSELYITEPMKNDRFLFLRLTAPFGYKFYVVDKQKEKMFFIGATGTHRPKKDENGYLQDHPL